jgi:hypothetical protein
MFLAILNIFDGIITFVGLQGLFMEEANPLMYVTYSASPLLFLILKFMLSFLLMFLVYKNAIPSFKWIKQIGYIGIAMYLATFFLHGVWILQTVIY